MITNEQVNDKTLCSLLIKNTIKIVITIYFHLLILKLTKVLILMKSINQYKRTRWN